MVYIYILELEGNKYYVGKTNNPDFRIDSHFSSNGSAWTKKYPPVRIMELLPNRDDYDEDKYTIKYMDRMGINNVRGGSFCQMELSTDNMNTIQQMMKGTTDKCYTCGKSGHFCKECTEGKNDKESSVSDSSKSISSFFFGPTEGKDGTRRCERCERKGHEEEECYAKTYENGEEISDEEIVWCCNYCEKEFLLKRILTEENCALK